MEQPVQRDVVEAAQGGDLEAFEALATRCRRPPLRDRDPHPSGPAACRRRRPGSASSTRGESCRVFGTWIGSTRGSIDSSSMRAPMRVGNSVAGRAEVRMIRSEPTTEDGVQSLADRDQLERGFRRLKPEQRTVVVLHFYRRAARPGDRRNARHPGRHREVPAPLRDGDPPRRARRGRARSPIAANGQTA